MRAIKFLFFLAATTSLFVCSSCSKLEEATTIKVPVPDFSFEIPAIVTSNPLDPALRSALDLNHFSGSATLSINDDMFKDLKKNQSFITSIVIGVVNISVSSSSGGGVAENLMLSSPEVGNFTIAQYTFGDVYSSTELAAYATNLFTKFIEKGQITVSVSGDTDVEDGELIVGLYFGSIEIKAKVLDL